MGLFTRDRETDWPEAMATVIACRYDARVGRAIAFGLPSNRHFRISFHFHTAEGERTGEFYARKAMPVATLFPLRYHPTDPGRDPFIPERD